MSNEPPHRRGIPFVVSAPSGTGKTSVCRAALERDRDLRFSVSHTTRAPRTGEVDGRDYRFVNSADFRRMVDDGAFLEHAEYAGQLYGTSWEALEAPLTAGCDLLLEIEVQGARQIHERLTDARMIFLLPPSLDTLEARLRARGTDSDDVVERRLALVDRELAAVSFFDYALVNDDLDQCVQELLSIVRAERDDRAGPALERWGRAQVLKSWTARVDAPS